MKKKLTTNQKKLMTVKGHTEGRSKANVGIDKSIKAKAPAFHTVKSGKNKGKVYFEGRANRTDIKGKKV